MGQYHILVNLTKKQFVHPHQIGNGLKLHEQIGFDCSTSTALTMLLAVSNGRGAGDFSTNHPLIGSWAGDAIAFVGDYSEKADIKGVNAKLIYDACVWVKHGSVKKNIHKPYVKNHPRFMAFASQWTNISLEVQKMMGEEFNVTYTGDGWLDIQENTGAKSSVKMAPDLVIYSAK
jgi:hypothetical protein